MKTFNKLKIKTLKEKPRKVLAINIEYENHLAELSTFLLGLTDKKFDVILNGRLTKFNSSVAKSKFVEGFDFATRILMEEYTKVSVEINTERQRLLNQIATLKRTPAAVKIKEEPKATEMAMELRVASWKDRIVELEDTCKTLREELKRQADGNKQIEN